MPQDVMGHRRPRALVGKAWYSRLGILAVVASVVSFGTICPIELMAAQSYALGSQQTDLPQPGNDADVGLSLAVRIDCARAVEEIYWAHSLWPLENKQQKPRLSDVLPEGRLLAIAQDALLMTTALEERYGRPIDAAALTREVERMARNTRAPDLLRAMFAALRDDPKLVAECLARPAIARRWLEESYFQDQVLHAQVRDSAMRAYQSAMQSDSAGAIVEHLTLTLDSNRPDGIVGDIPVKPIIPGAIPLDDASWKSELERFDAPTFLANDATLKHADNGSPVSFEETKQAWVLRRLISRSHTQAQLEIWRFEKQGFDAWWAAERRRYAMEAHGVKITGSLPDIEVQESDTKGSADQWLLENVPIGRSGHTAIWTGTKMVVWGASGNNSGGQYDPALDTWTQTSTLGAPLSRTYHTAVWTGTEMIVWGGRLGGSEYANSGGRYAPLTDTWTPTSTSGAPSGRYLHTAIWSGSKLVIWGGFNGNHLGSGAQYNPGSDSWTSTPTSSAPSSRSEHTAVWTGSEMIVWGGRDVSGYLNSGARLDPALNSWTATSNSGAPQARVGHTAVWAGSRMIVWGASASGGQPANTGGRYDPATDAWTSTSTIGAPSPRSRHTSVWTGTKMIIWGGTDNSTMFDNGGLYDPALNNWTATSNAGKPLARAGHTAVWTGALMIVWGGSVGNSGANSGGRYNPNLNSWTPTATSGAPSARAFHTAIWTGTQMIVWGGVSAFGGISENSGGRYNPALDTWTTTASTGAPTGRYQHSTVWTGTHMIIWGGLDANGATNSGAIYDPLLDTWDSASTPNALAGRSDHAAAWNGSEMIVWGGQIEGGALVNTGGRYNPASDSWAAISTIGAPPGRRLAASVWSGSELLVWGGYADDTPVGSGGRYNPALDAWTMISQSAAPTARYEHSAVWTGTHMIIWGGFDALGAANSGSRYDPNLDIWSETSVLGAPLARGTHSAVWTGSDMILWGGWGGGVILFFNSGGLYDPIADQWTPTTSEGAPTQRQDHTAVWSGTEMIIFGGRINGTTKNDLARYFPYGLSSRLFSDGFE